MFDLAPWRHACLICMFPQTSIHPIMPYLGVPCGLPQPTLCPYICKIPFPHIGSLKNIIMLNQNLALSSPRSSVWWECAHFTEAGAEAQGGQEAIGLVFWNEAPLAPHHSCPSSVLFSGAPHTHTWTACPFLSYLSNFSFLLVPPASIHNAASFA